MHVILDLNDTPEEKRIDILGLHIRGENRTDVEIVGRLVNAHSYQLEAELKNWCRPGCKTDRNLPAAPENPDQLKTLAWGPVLHKCNHAFVITAALRPNHRCVGDQKHRSEISAQSVSPMEAGFVS
jgi:hypothetical protein